MPIILVLLQVLIPVLIRYTRQPKRQSYLPSSLVVCSECMKTLGCLTMVALTPEPSGISRTYRMGSLTGAVRGIIHSFTYVQTFILPALFYFLSNVFSVLGVTQVRSSVFQVMMNARVVLAGLLSVLILKQRITPSEVRAILLIFCGATMLCLEQNESDKKDSNKVVTSLGITYSIIAVIASGSACQKNLYILSLHNYLHNLLDCSFSYS